MKLHYVDVPIDVIQAGFKIHPPSRSIDCNVAVQAALNVPYAKFVYNSCAGLTDGDLFLIGLHPTDTELLFVLRTGCTIVNPDAVAEYNNIKSKQQLTF